MKHSEGFLKLVNDAKTRIREMTVAETQARLKQNAEAKLVDVREDNEWNTAHDISLRHCREFREYCRSSCLVLHPYNKGTPKRFRLTGHPEYLFFPCQSEDSGLYQRKSSSGSQS